VQRKIDAKTNAVGNKEILRQINKPWILIVEAKLALFLKG
jgi:hypothetical protein